MSLRNLQNDLNTTQQPSWFQNPKRRTIPNHLVPQRKPGFQTLNAASTKEVSRNKEDNADVNEPGQFNILSFGTSQRRAATSSGTFDSNSSIMSPFETYSGDLSKLERIGDVSTDDFPLHGNDDDIPPSRSIYDLNDEVLISLRRPADLYSESSINKDPKKFNNLFNKEKVSDIYEKKMDENLEHNPLENGKSAILVFGYPENMANQVIAHFLEFGTVLEEFEVAKTRHSFIKQYQVAANETSKQIVPIFCGDSWVKITYDNPSSALDALQENGNVFNGHLLGVIPYSKTAVEKLQKRKINKEEDIGGGIQYQLDAFNKGQKSEPGVESDLQSTYISKMEIKDGSGLLLKANSSEPVNSKPDKKKKEDMSLVSRACKYLFGFYEL